MMAPSIRCDHRAIFVCLLFPPSLSTAPSHSIIIIIILNLLQPPICSYLHSRRIHMNRNCAYWSACDISRFQRFIKSEIICKWNDKYSCSWKQRSHTFSLIGIGVDSRNIHYVVPERLWCSYRRLSRPRAPNIFDNSTPVGYFYESHELSVAESDV